VGAAPHRVRIVGGAWKRTPLQVPDVEGLRPTPDRVRETLFNWLGREVSGASCLDLFAGTGALGLEAASRGAAAVWLVEKDRRAQAAIRATLERLGAAQVSLVPGDALAALERARREGRRFDLVLLDPPFGAGLLERVLPLLPAVLSEDAAIYVENGEALTEETLGRLLGPGFRIDRAGRAGQVFYHLVLRSTPQESD
jgi:16S rRNA (guanine(966)-N(2))-methyltransferase RsmD